MTQTKALMQIAQYYGGLIRTQDLKRYLQAAGLMKKSKNAGGMTYRLVANNDLFERISTGLYRLKESHPKKPLNAIASGEFEGITRGHLFPSKPI